MDSLPNGLLDLDPVATQVPSGHPRDAVEVVESPDDPKDPEFLRQLAWDIGARRPAERYAPPASHVGLAMVTPAQGFAHWHIRQDWVDQTARQKGGAWHNCRLVLRLYDVSYIEFNGLNAHRIQDHTLPRLSGNMMFSMPSPGSWQLGEVGFLLRNGEFIPAARSLAVSFARDSAYPRQDHAGLFVSPRGRIEPVGNVWEQERHLRKRLEARLRHPLRIAAFSFTSQALGHQGTLAQFVSELALGQHAAGHEVHMFVPACDALPTDGERNGVQYHALDVGSFPTPMEQAAAFRSAALERLYDFPPFDLIHLHEWMTGLAPRLGHQPAVLSLSSLESTRRNGAPETELSRTIAEVEREAAQAADCILTPDWLRDQAIEELEVDGARVLAFPMEGRIANEWECRLDFGQVKKSIGLGPLDRMLLYVGPLEHAAGVDLLVEALPTILNRCNNVRMVFAGAGPMDSALANRAHQLGVGGAIRVLGHVQSSMVTRLVRSAEALMLPSRYRVPFDDAVVDLARRAGRPVVTTHSGPAHLVRHEENGIVTYDNPGSIVWASDRILSNATHAQRMGQNGRRSEQGTVAWCDVARHYLELCAAHFPELNEARWEE